MGTIIVLFFAALVLATAMGWTTDTRDSADWKFDDREAPLKHLL